MSCDCSARVRHAPYLWETLNRMEPALQRWLQQNPFLLPLAHFEGLVRGATEGLVVAPLDLAPWNEHQKEHLNGVALLLGESHGEVLRAAAADLLGPASERAVAARLPSPLGEGMKEVREALARPSARSDAIRWALSGATPASAPVQAALLQLLVWKTFARVLAPVLEPFAAWRNGQKWGRATCPLCGALPMMAHARGGERTLVCGCCTSRWRDAPPGCPHCGNRDAGRRARLESKGAAGLRLDVCEACKGYLKIYTGEGEEAVFLADWPTLALDGLAAERGYRRRGASLWEL
jgi:FdhE protein